MPRASADACCAPSYAVRRARPASVQRSPRASPERQRVEGEEPGGCYSRRLISSATAEHRVFIIARPPRPPAGQVDRTGTLDPCGNPCRMGITFAVRTVRRASLAALSPIRHRRDLERTSPRLGCAARCGLDQLPACAPSLPSGAASSAARRNSAREGRLCAFGTEALSAAFLRAPLRRCGWTGRRQPHPGAFARTWAAAHPIT
jgi:hypothetical protein